jgi:hypothetical protein
MTLPIKQDAQTQATLQKLIADFATKVQPAIDAALNKSQIVHFARVLVIDNKYIQVITCYEGPHQEYTEFFRRELTPVFAAIFSLAEGAPDVKDTNAFWEYSKNHNIRALGMVPVSVNGLGVREALYILLFGQVGVSPELAVSLALVYLAVTVVASLPGGLVYALQPTSMRLSASGEAAPNLQ